VFACRYIRTKKSESYLSLGAKMQAFFFARTFLFSYKCVEHMPLMDAAAPHHAGQDHGINNRSGKNERHFQQRFENGCSLFSARSQEPRLFISMTRPPVEVPALVSSCSP